MNEKEANRKEREKERKRLYRIANREKLREKAAVYNKSHVEQHKEYRLINKDKIKEKRRLRLIEQGDEIRAKARAYNQALGPEYFRKKIHAYYLANPEKFRERARTFRKNHPNTVKGYRLKTHYGLTRADYDRLILEQGGACAICGRKDWTGKWKNPQIDHDHDTGKVRGILCVGCNTAIGLLKNDPRIVRAIINYLVKYKTEPQTTDKGIKT